MGISFCAFHVYWLNEVSNFPILGFLLIVFYTGLFFGVFGLLFCLISRRLGWPIILFAPILWVTMEYLRSNLSFLAIPWGLLGHSQYNNSAVIQIASITSVYGISFLIILVNAALTEGLLWILTRRTKVTSYQRPLKIALSSILIAFSALLIVILWGNYQIKKLQNNQDDLLKVSLIQGNIPQNEKWDRRFRKKISERYRQLTLKAAQNNPDLIIWPESATPGYLEKNSKIYRTVRDLVQEMGVPLLLGSATHAKIGKGKITINKFKNGAFLMDKNGKILSSYYKIRLLPFSEYLPLEGRFPWPECLVRKNTAVVPGNDITVFKHLKRRFGVVICWENLFPALFRKFVKAGSQFMVNLTNEAWFGKSAASRQIMAMSIFRAVENRVSLVRSANTGISCLIDPLGKVQKRIMDEKGNDIMVPGELTVSVPKPLGKTFYTAYGNLFSISCALTSILLIMIALLPDKIREIFKIQASQEECRHGEKI